MTAIIPYTTVLSSHVAATVSTSQSSRSSSNRNTVFFGRFKIWQETVKSMAFPSVDSTLALRPCVYSFVSKYATLSSVTALSVIPLLNVCLVARKYLYGKIAHESKYCDQVAVVTWREYGTFSWQGVQDIVQIHKPKDTKLSAYLRCLIVTRRNIYFLLPQNHCCTRQKSKKSA